jgi:hypothetical protein
MCEDDYWEVFSNHQGMLPDQYIPDAAMLFLEYPAENSLIYR